MTSRGGMATTRMPCSAIDIDKAKNDGELDLVGVKETFKGQGHGEYALKALERASKKSRHGHCVLSTCLGWHQGVDETKI